MLQLAPTTNVGKLFLRCAASAAFGAVVSYFAAHPATLAVTALAHWQLHRRALASPHIGVYLLAVLVMIAGLLAASVATERRRNAFLEALAARGRRLTCWLISNAASTVCFLCGALAGFGGKGWLAGLLMLVMYTVVLGALYHMVLEAQRPPRR